MGRTLCIAGLLLATGCGAGVDAQCADVGVHLQVQKQRLEVVRREIAESERRAADARRRAEFHECRAVVSSIKADATINVAKCEQEHAVVQKCHAQNEAHTANSSIVGCLAGIGIAAATAGVGTPIALAGCGAGYLVGKGTADDCPTSTCSHDPGLALAEAAKKQNRTSLFCGGMIGVSLSAPSAQIATVNPGSPAARAQLVPGDVILAVNQTPVRAASEVVEALEQHPPGEVVMLACVRNGNAFQVPITLTPHPQ